MFLIDWAGRPSFQSVIKNIYVAIVLGRKSNDDFFRKYIWFKDDQKKCDLEFWFNNAGNHLFDDHFKYFGITEKEGSLVRAFFQMQNIDDKVTEYYLMKLGVLEV